MQRRTIRVAFHECEKIVMLMLRYEAGAKMLSRTKLHYLKKLLTWAMSCHLANWLQRFRKEGHVRRFQLLILYGGPHEEDGGIRARYLRRTQSLPLLASSVFVFVPFFRSTLTYIEFCHRQQGTTGASNFTALAGKQKTN